MTDPQTASNIAEQLADFQEEAGPSRRVVEEGEEGYVQDVEDQGVEDNNEDEESGDDEDDDDDDEEEDFDPMSAVTQCLVTEDGVPIVDVLAGINRTLEKLAKIMFKLSVTIETHLRKA